MNDLLNQILSEGVLVFNEDRTIKEMDKRRLYQITKKYFQSKYPLATDEIESKSVGTFYNVLKKVPLVFIVGIALDLITEDEFLNGILKECNKDIIIDIKFNKEYKDIVEQFDDLYSRWWDAVRGVTATESADDVIITTSVTFDFSGVDSSKEKVLDTVLGSYGLPPFSNFKDKITSSSSLESIISSLKGEKDTLTKETEDLRKKLTDALSKPTITEFKVESTSSTIPNGEMKMAPISSVFPDIKLKMDVPVFEWDGPHPLVPIVDEHYIFRPELLIRVLYAIINNKRAYLQGHTGTGKTTLLEQVAARLKWPFLRINFDSEITRMDLIGRDTLVEEGGKTVSKFVDGMLPQMMSQPCIACFDEVDACRPDVSYVMQSVLENNGLRITEDGGRLVNPHPMFRMFATGNTVGQGDEMGMYQAVRPQSLALLDRFTVWLKVDYLSEQERKQLFERHYPAISPVATEMVMKYVTEHLYAFTEGKVLQPISPRGMLAIGDVIQFLSINGKDKDNKKVQQALSAVILDRASRSDYTVLHGIVDRVVK